MEPTVNEEVNESLSTKVAADTKQEFRVAAAEAGMTMSEFLRRLVEGYLEAQHGAITPGDLVWDIEKDKAALVTENRPPDTAGDVTIAYVDSLRKYDDLDWGVYPHGDLDEPDRDRVRKYNRNTDDLTRV